MKSNERLVEVFRCCDRQGAEKRKPLTTIAIRNLNPLGDKRGKRGPKKSATGRPDRDRPFGGRGNNRWNPCGGLTKAGKTPHPTGRASAHRHGSQPAG